MRINIPAIVLLAAGIASSGCMQLALPVTGNVPPTAWHAGPNPTSNFDHDWTFARFGPQADDTVIPEPGNVAAADFNDAAWRRLDLPHDFGVESPFRLELAGETGKLPWRGIGWYRKHFKAPDAGKRVFVDFDGAMAYAEVWCNGQKAGAWPYGYNSFRVDVTPFLQVGGDNVLAVRVDTTKWDSRWYPGAGIYRHVWLTTTDPIHVAHWGTYITTPKITPQEGLARVAVTVDNQSSAPARAVVCADIRVLSDDGTPGAKVGESRPITLELAPAQSGEAVLEAPVAAPRLWSLEDPARYLARTTVSVAGKVVDTYVTPFGFRTLEFTARKGFLLNGKRVQIQGTCNHHDLGALGAALNNRALERQLQMLKEMGCNSLRTSHNPPAPELLDLADRMGFLVWDEAFDCWATGKKANDYNKLYAQWHEKDLQAMVRRDRNHPSVFIWSIGNEVMDQTDVAMTRHLVDIVRAADPTRPVSAGYNNPDGGRACGAAEALDLMGVNYFFGQQERWDSDPRYKDKPTLGSESSSCVSSRGEYYEETPFQIPSFDTRWPGWGCSPDTQFETLQRWPHLLGEYVWTGWDYLGEPTPYNSDPTTLLNFRSDPAKRAELQKELDALAKRQAPSRSSYFGIIDLAGFPKDRFYSYQAHWRPELPVAHIAPQNWNWPERAGKDTPVHAYTNGDEGELFLNGKSLGRLKRVHFRLFWNVKYEPGELKIVTYKDGKEWATDIVRTTGAAAQLQLSADRTQINADGADLSFITVRVADKDGRTVPDAHPAIAFSVEGPGEIVATDNGDATCLLPFSSQVRPAFHGLALVIVKAKRGQAAAFTVSAQSEGCAPAQIVIAAK